MAKEKLKQNTRGRRKEARDEAPAPPPEPAHVPVRRGPGRPRKFSDESGQPMKVMLSLRKDQVIWLDLLSVAIRDKSDRPISRTDLIRAFVDAVRESGLYDEFLTATTEADIRDAVAARLRS